MKRCARCGEVKPLSEFYKDKRGADGRESRCIECRKQRNREWYAKNAKEHCERCKRNRAENPEKYRELNRRWHEANPERVRELARLWREANPEKCREAQRRYFAKDPEGVRKKVRKTSKRWREANIEECREKAREYCRRRYAEDPRKGVATSSVYQATQNGTLVRPNTCSNCGKECKVHGHHDDYSKPLDVLWLCPVCHKAMHMKG